MTKLILVLAMLVLSSASSARCAIAPFDKWGPELEYSSSGSDLKDFHKLPYRFTFHEDHEGSVWLRVTDVKRTDRTPGLDRLYVSLVGIPIHMVYGSEKPTSGEITNIDVVEKTIASKAPGLARDLAEWAKDRPRGSWLKALFSYDLALLRRWHVQSPFIQPEISGPVESQVVQASPESCSVGLTHIWHPPTDMPDVVRTLLGDDKIVVSVSQIDGWPNQLEQSVIKGDSAFVTAHLSRTHPPKCEG